MAEASNVSDRTGLGDRMKAYECAARTILPPRTYSVLRVDGRAFHSYLRGAERPFDYAFMADMDATAMALCEDIQGAVFAYVQSDEISVLMTDFTGPNSQPWFAGEVQKQVSIAAATATAALNARRYDGPNGAPPSDRLAAFDARVFTLPSAVEVANYYLWRQRDAVRNSIAMAAQARFSHRQLHGVNTGRMQEMLRAEHGINWNDYPDGAKRGRVVVRRSGEREVTFTHKRTGQEETVKAMRSWWAAEGAPHFTLEPGGFLAEAIPELPTLTRGEDGGA
jgi:tRNA(His) 5'-end guanylyltransferase